MNAGYLHKILTSKPTQGLFQVALSGRIRCSPWFGCPKINKIKLSTIIFDVGIVDWYPFSRKRAHSGKQKGHWMQCLCILRKPKQPLHSQVWAWITIYVCMYFCLYVCMFVCMYAWIYVFMHVCMFVRMYVCTYLYIFACMYVCMDVCMYVCMYVCM